MTLRRRLHLFRTLIALGAIASGFVATAAWLVNRPETLHHALAVANLRSPWKIGVGRLEWKPLGGELLLQEVGLVNAEEGKSLQADRVRIGYRLLGLLRGKLVFDAVEVDGVRMELPTATTPHPKHSRGRINLARLVLLKNLELQDVKIGSVKIAFGTGAQSSFAADELRLSLIPTFFGDTKFFIRADGMLLSKGDRPIVSAGMLSLKTSTDLARWDEAFPYLNGIDGVLKVADIGVQGLEAESLSASVSYLDGFLKLSPFAIAIGGNPLEGQLTADAADGRFELWIDIPRPIAIPHFGRRLQTMDLGGQIAGHVRLAGQGLIPSETSGQGRVELSHRFDAHPETPVAVSTDVTWAKGSIAFPRALVQLGKVSVAASGTVDIPHRKFKLEASGKDFLLEDLFLEFRNPYLKRIFGPTDFTGSIEGWGKQFKAKVAGTTRGGGWRPITAERVETELEATYDDLKLQGTIFSGARQTGRADLKIHFGPKIGDADRTKQIELEADLVDHPVEDSLAAYGLSGVGNGHLKLSGPHTAFKGEVTARIERGALHSLPFDLAGARLSIARRQIIFSNMALKLPSIAAAPLSGTLVGDISEGSLRLHGTPMEGLSVDATYRGADARWLVKELSWSDPDRPGDRLAASGSYQAAGGIDLKLGGRVDLGAAAFIAPLMREGSGPVDVDLSVRGSSDNPRLGGSLVFHNNAFSPRGARLALEHMNGALRFEGSRIRFDGTRAKIDEGEVQLGGSVDLRGLAIGQADLTLEGSDMRYRSEDASLSLDLNGAIAVTGPFPSPLVKGDITILDGKYAKDFTLLDAIAGGKTKRPTPKREAFSDFDPRLDLRVRNSGDLAIRNNVGDIWLNVNVDVKGTRKKPTVFGSIETTEGRVHYLGIDFDITKGFVEFPERSEAPYLEVTAQKEVGVYNVNILLHGSTDNLALDLSATSPSGPLEKRDVISLLLFGVTEQDRTTLAQQAGAGGLLTTQMAGQAISGVFGRPIQKAAHLDVFRLEASTPGKASNVSRIYVGKQLTDRLTVNFATDINTTNAVQTVIGEYQITDNLLLTGQRSSDANYKVNGLLRFRLR